MENDIRTSEVPSPEMRALRAGLMVYGRVGHCDWNYRQQTNAKAITQSILHMPPS